MNCPSFELYGTYFPAWMLCALCGVLASALLYVVLWGSGVHAELPWPALVYPSTLLAIAFGVWIRWYGHG